MICPKCGEDNSEKFRFCGMCGALLDPRADSRPADSRIADTRPTAATSIRPSAFSIPTPPVKRDPPEPSSIPRASARIEPRFPPPAARNEPKIAAPVQREFVPPVRHPVVVESTARQPERMVPPISGPSMLGLDLAVNQVHEVAESRVVTDRVGDVKPKRDLEDLDISRSKPTEYIASNSVARATPSRFDDMSGDAFRQNSFTGFDKYIEQEEHKSGAGRVMLLLLLLVGVAVAGWWTYNNYRGIAQSRKAQSEAASAVEAPPDSQSTPAATPAPAPAAKQPATPASDVPEGPSENASPLPDNTAKSAGHNADSSAGLNSSTDSSPTGSAAPTPAPKTAPSSSSGDRSAAEAPDEKPLPVAKAPARTAPAARVAVQPRQPARPTVQARPAAPRKLPPPAREPAASRARASRVAPVEPEDTGDSSFRKAEAYLYGRGAPQNCDEAVKNLKAASAKSNAKARSAFGTMYATGHCVPRDLPTSYLWFALALRVDPNNQVLEKNLTAVWNQMTAPERQMATRMKQ